MIARLLMVLMMGLTMVMAEVYIPQGATLKPLQQVKKPAQKGATSKKEAMDALNYKSPHPGYQITVQWIKEFGVSDKLNTFINFQPDGNGYGLMYGVLEGPKYSKYLSDHVNAFRYIFTYMDLDGQRLWEVEYLPRKIRFVADFKMEKDGKIYVLGWGGKRMDVWYIESFTRADPRGKAVARMLKKNSCPSVLLSEEKEWVALGSPLYTGKDSKNKLMVWRVDKNTRKDTFRETSELPINHLRPNEIYRASLPQFRAKESRHGGWYLFDHRYEVDKAFRLSPTFLIEHSYGENTGDIVDVKDDIVLSKRENDRLWLMRCDERCRHPEWKSDVDKSYSATLTKDGGWIVFALSNGDLGAYRSINGKPVWRTDYFGKSEKYRLDDTLCVLNRPGSTHEYVRVGYRGEWFSGMGTIIDQYKLANATIFVMDVKVEKTGK